MLYRFEYNNKFITSIVLEEPLDPKQLVIIETVTENSRKRDAYEIDEIALCIPTTPDTKPYRLVILDK